MGQMVGKITEPLLFCSGTVSNILSGRQKRKRSMGQLDSSSRSGSEDGHTPKKKKLLTTTQYIYQALFKEQKNSDISVMALDKVWKLHKVYLSQSPYFYSMFNGSWRESDQDFVHIQILDSKITLEALESVFGSMYSDEIEIVPKDVIGVLATATLFHLESIIEKCAEVMIENLNIETAVSYYEAACEYGCMSVKKAAFEWLEINLLCVYNKNQQLLRDIGVDLMTALIGSPDLYVMQTEFSLYTLLRAWVFLRLSPDFDSQAVTEANAQQTRMVAESSSETSISQAQSATSSTAGDTKSLTVDNEIVQAYFANYCKSRCFLSTPIGQQYSKPFQMLRTQYLTNHHMDLKIVLRDNIIPKEWLHNHVLSHWASVLKVDHSPEDGPQNLEPEEFHHHCMRCGRILPEPGYQKWRWTGFNFGLDLILIADSRMLTIRRHHRNEHERLLSLQTKRHFMIRIAVSSVNAQRQPTFTQKTEIKSLCLEKNEEMRLMHMDTKLVHPLLISVNLLVVQPTPQGFKGDVTLVDDANTIPISEFGTNCEMNKSDNSVDSAVCVVPFMSSVEERPPSITSNISTSSLTSTESSVRL